MSHAVENLKIPVTAKIRVFDDIGKTVEYAKMVASTGISVIFFSSSKINKSN